MADLVCATTGKNYGQFWHVSEVDFGMASTLNCDGTTVYLDSAVISTTYVGLLPHDEWFADVEYGLVDSTETVSTTLSQLVSMSIRVKALRTSPW